MAEKAQPVSKEVLEKMEQTVPSDDNSIYSAFEEQQSTLPAVFGGLLGLQNKDPYSIIERTNLAPEEVHVLIDMMRLAEHGIGSPKSLDRPIPYIAKQVVNYMRAKISITSKDGHGMSREEVVDALTAWSRTLENREAQQKAQNKAGGTAG